LTGHWRLSTARGNETAGRAGLSHYLYSGAAFPCGAGPLESLDRAAASLSARIAGLDIDRLDISDYNRRYFGSHVASIRQVLQYYTYVLCCAFSQAARATDDLVFIDYGGGSGLLSLLARELGVRTAIYVDIYDVSCRDAELIARSLGLPADVYLTGDIDELLAFLEERRIACDVLASVNVIEHIYDIEGFLSKLGELPGPGLSVALSSDANDENPWERRSFARLHRRIEHEDRTRGWGHKERDSLESYRSIRRRLISECAADLSCEELDRLAAATRGLRAADIRARVNAYRCTGEMPEEPKHPTNTCDPRTGNWAERLLSPEYLRERLAGEGFGAEVLRGYYGASLHPLKRLIGPCLNRLIAGLGSRGLTLSPFYVLRGCR